jgi:hypothetical protein
MAASSGKIDRRYVELMEYWNGWKSEKEENKQL